MREGLLKMTQSRCIKDLGELALGLPARDKQSRYIIQVDCGQPAYRTHATPTAITTTLSISKLLTWHFLQPSVASLRRSLALTDPQHHGRSARREASLSVHAPGLKACLQDRPGKAQGESAQSHHLISTQRGALKNEAFKDYVCAPVGQGWHWLSVKAKRLVTDGARREVRRLDPTEAVQEGAEILAEVFVFGIASSYVVYEYIKSNQKSAAQKAELNKLVQYC